MAKIESHRDLIVWQKAMDLTVEVYRLASMFPGTEIYRLTAQVTRSAASVPANIAEGHSRSTRRDYANFFGNRQRLPHGDRNVSHVGCEAWLCEPGASPVRDGSDY